MMRVPSPRGVHNRLAGMASWGWARRLHGARNSIKTMASVNVRSFSSNCLAVSIPPSRCQFFTLYSWTTFNQLKGLGVDPFVRYVV